MEMYFSDARVLVAEHELGEQLVPAALLALLVLALAQLPVSVWLVRRTTAAQQDRDRMLDTVLVSSERERRLLARHLHDGVVQELSGAALLLEERLPDAVGPGRGQRARSGWSRTSCGARSATCGTCWWSCTRAS